MKKRFLIRYLSIIVSFVSIFFLVAFDNMPAHAMSTSISTCSSNYWQQDVVTYKSSNNFDFSLEIYSLRDGNSNLYCGQVKALVGVWFPANNGANYDFQIQYYTNGNYINSTWEHINPPYNARTGPYTLWTPAWSVPGGQQAVIIPVIYFLGSQKTNSIWAIDTPY